MSRSSLCSILGLLVILLSCFPPITVADKFYRDYCYCTSKEAHSASVHTIRYRNDRIPLDVGWSDLCWDFTEPEQRVHHGDRTYRKGGCRWYREPHRVRCKMLNDGNTVEYFKICHNRRLRENVFTVNGKIGVLPDGKSKHVKINLDCTNTCRYHFGDRGWNNLTSWCNYTAPYDRKHKLIPTNPPFECKTVLWEGVADVLLEEQPHNGIGG